MSITTADIALILGICFLPQEKINSLTEVDIKHCYYNTIKLYHPDKNFLNNPFVVKDELSKIINLCYEEAKKRIEELRNISHIEAEIIHLNCQSYPEIYQIIISNLVNSGMDMLILLRSLRAIDSGNFIPRFLSELEALYGKEFLTLFLLACQKNEADNQFEIIVDLIYKHLLYIENYKEKVKQLVEFENFNKKYKPL